MSASPCMSGHPRRVRSGSESVPTCRRGDGDELPSCSARRASIVGWQPWQQLPAPQRSAISLDRRRAVLDLPPDPPLVDPVTEADQRHEVRKVHLTAQSTQPEHPRVVGRGDRLGTTIRQASTHDLAAVRRGRARRVGPRPSGSACPLATGMKNFSGSDATSASRSSFGNAKPISVSSGRRRARRCARRGTSPGRGRAPRRREAASRRSPGHPRCRRPSCPGGCAPGPHRRPARWRSPGRHGLASLAHQPMSAAVSCTASTTRNTSTVPPRAPYHQRLG